MTLALALAVATTFAAADAPPTDHSSEPTAQASACADVFDRAPGCAQVNQQPLSGVAEPLTGEPRLNTGVAPFDADAMAWRLIASSGVVGVFGGGLFAASVAYGIYAAEIKVGPGDPLLVTEYATRLGSFGAFVIAGLLASAGGIFFVFDPSTGRLRLDLSED